MKLSAARLRYLRKSLSTPDRIVIGQMACSHDVASEMCDLGLWERTVIEEFHGTQHQRYRITDKGRAALVEVNE